MNSLDKIKLIVEYAAQNKVTTLCAIVWTVVSLITANPSSIAFIGPSAQALTLQIATFFKTVAVGVGLLFAADSKMPKLTDSEKPAKKVKKPIKKSTEE